MRLTAKYKTCFYNVKKKIILNKREYNSGHRTLNSILLLPANFCEFAMHLFTYESFQTF